MDVVRRALRNVVISLGRTSIRSRARVGCYMLAGERGAGGD
jgi:hypothetical protein